LLEGEQVLSGQPDVLLLGHAVLAAEVAPVGDRHPQVAERPAERVGDEGACSGGHGSNLASLCLRCGRRCCLPVGAATLPAGGAPPVSLRAIRGVLRWRCPRRPRATGLGALRVAGGVALAASALAAGVPAAWSQDPRATPPALTVVTLNVLHGGAFSGLSGNDEHLEERLALAIPALRGL